MGSLAADEDEHLEDGCSVATPDGDNLVMDHARAEAAAYGAAAASVGGRLHDDDVAGLHLRDTGAPSPFGNAALLTLPVGEDDGDALAEHLLDFYRQQSGGPFLVMSPWRTPDWSGHGFRRVGHPPLMYRPPGPPSPSTAPESGIEVVEVVGDEMLAAFEATLIEAYPVPEMQPARRNSLLGPSILESDWTLLAGRVDGRVVATSAAYRAPSLTLVEFVSARPETRGRGVGAAMTAAAALVRPEVPATLIASDDGQGVYRALGFLPLHRHTVWLGFR